MEIKINSLCPHSLAGGGGVEGSTNEIDAFGLYLARLAEENHKWELTDETILGSVSYEYYLKDSNYEYVDYSDYPTEIATGKKSIFYGIYDQDDSTKTHGVGLLNVDIDASLEYQLKYNENGDITFINKLHCAINTYGITNYGIPSGATLYNDKQSDSKFILQFGGGNNPSYDDIPSNMKQFRYKDLKNFKSFLDTALAELRN